MRTKFIVTGVLFTDWVDIIRRRAVWKWIERHGRHVTCVVFDIRKREDCGKFSGTCLKGTMKICLVQESFNLAVRLSNNCASLIILAIKDIKSP